MIKTKEHSILWRFLISAVGVALIIIAIVNLLLFFLGETAAANVKTRRVGGADDSRTVSQRYEWSLDYTFLEKSGVKHSGHSTRRGSDISVKTDGRVYYFSFAPYISALESEAEPNLSQPVFLVVGVFLIYVMNRGGSRRGKRRNQMGA